jgi:hypothetical protein
MADVSFFFFFFLQKRGKEGKTGPVCGGYQWEGEGYKERV